MMTLVLRSPKKRLEKYYPMEVAVIAIAIVRNHHEANQRVIMKVKNLLQD
jgi:hypothetical protein